MRPWMRICAVLAASAVLPAKAAPFLPQSDDQVLERLPFTANDPILAELHVLNARLKDGPGDLKLALRVARGYLELSRLTGDPRYAGYAQAALASWWALPQAPKEVLILRATLRQRMHQFDAALADLGAVLEHDPRNAQARLIRATVRQVVGDYEGARQDCLALRGASLELIKAACLASADGVTGRLQQSHDLLQTTLEQNPGTQPSIRSWALTSLAEMAARANHVQEADARFREALAIDPADAYLLGAYADFLLEQNRPREVLDLLRDKIRADPLLLRYVLALQATQSPELAARITQLRDRFEASHLRGDKVHLREEARFTLHVLKDPGGALKLAWENWAVQKEPADLRILIEAAAATSDATTSQAARDWLTKTGLEDAAIRKISASLAQPN